MKKFDVIVIGGGIAGVSVAAELSRSMKVVLLEREAQTAYHSTGRSAAYYAPAYGNSVVRLLTRLGESFYKQPTSSFTEVPLFRPRDAVFVANESQAASMQLMKEETPHLQEVDDSWLKTTVPILEANNTLHGLRDTEGGDLDVHAIMQGYVSQCRREEVEFVMNAEVVSLKREGQEGVWQASTSSDTFQAPVIVNAAGAWADEVAQMAEVPPVGLTPKRRTAILIDAPSGMAIESWPLVIDVDENFYFKPDAGQILISPADETPTEPADAQAEELDVAIAVDRFSQVTGMNVTKVNHRWAGLRTFSADKTFVIGFDPDETGFFWLAGQGGYGVQSAPGVSQLAAHLITGDRLPGGYEEAESCIAEVDPFRFR